MNTERELQSRPSSFFTPVVARVARGVQWFRSVTREDQKEVALAAELGLLGQHEAQFARAQLEQTREKFLGRTKS